MTVDASTAVAALVAAKDIEALEAAIEQSSFLDNTPGEDRQKLRGAGRAAHQSLPQAASRSCLAAPHRSEVVSVTRVQRRARG